MESHILYLKKPTNKELRFSIQEDPNMNVTVANIEKPGKDGIHVDFTGIISGPNTVDDMESKSMSEWP